MKDISDVVCCVVDTGLFLQAACRMAEDCNRTLYHNPEVRAFPSLKQGIIGRGFERVEWVADFWPQLEDIDLFIFPDSRLSGLQQHLESLGKKVWGSRRGIELEQRRQYFLDVLAELDLDVPTYEQIQGVDQLREYLRHAEDKYIKISHWRGDMETTHWRNWDLDEGWLDWLAVNFGSKVKNIVPFLVFDAIDTQLEIGADTYCVDGQWPSLMLNGFEGKDKSYLAAVTPREKMPKQLGRILSAFTPVLRDVRYRNQWSMEVRKAYFIDATARAGMPSTASQHLLWKNFPEIVWHGANGLLVQPEPMAKFAIEVMITSKGGGHDCYDAVVVPESIEHWCRFSNCAIIGGTYVFPPDELKGQDLGWLAAIGDTPKEVFDRIKEHADQLPDGLNADVESLADIIKEVETAEEEGIPFTEQPMPKPAEVIE